ncbi:hypothetical protein GE061_002934 [Apolygus lucorum]|uniref:Uncharacterized protein n=1 Tax=Apolygus lucorum TaxID=248454 RepID=A0A8S9X2E1_APOLU|nr:hypothetical protein GE061_002934 [Apolygus lucorum]
MEVVKSFQVRSAGYPCFPPSRHDSKRSLNEMKIRENRIYGEKMAAGATINEGQIETSVPFRSPLTVVLGRSPMSINEVRGKIMVENEDDLRAITVGPTDVMKIFSDRYEALVERKHRFTPFKDNNMSLWGKEHEGLERQLANIDKKYKFHSKSSPDLNADRFFEKIKELPEALRQAQEDPVIVHTINTRPKKEEMDGEMGEYIRSRRYRKETTDEFREAHNKRVSDMEANRKRVGDFNEYNNRSSLASTFPKTQPRTDSRFKQEQEEKQGSHFFGKSNREKDEDGFHKRAKPNRNQIDQAIIDWRLQTAVDSRIASESVPSIREPNTEVGRKKKWQKEEDRESRWSSGVKKSGLAKVRNTTDINVADTKSAKITLRRLLQETALSRAKDASPSGEEAIERPASRRRKIRKKCSELLASRTDNSEHGDNKMTSKIPHVRLVPKMSMTSIQSNASIDQNRAHQKEWSPVRPTVKKRSLRVIAGEVTSVANDSSRSGELLGRKTSEYKPEMYGKGIGEQRRKKQLGDEILSFESVLKMKGENQKNSEGSLTINHATERARRRLGPRRLRRKRPLGDEVLSFESVMKMKSENLKNSMVTPNSKECNAELGKKGRTVDQNKNQDNKMSEDGDQREEIGESVDSGTAKNSGTVIAKESQRSNSDKKAEGKPQLKEQRNENCRAEDNAVVRTGRQNKAQVQVVTQTEKVVPNDEQPETPSKEASNSEQLSKENAENSRAENTLKEKKTKEDKDISLPPPKSSSDYSEIWKHV